MSSLEVFRYKHNSKYKKDTDQGKWLKGTIYDNKTVTEAVCPGRTQTVVTTLW